MAWFVYISPSLALWAFLLATLAFAFPLWILACQVAATRRARWARTFVTNSSIQRFLSHGFGTNALLFLISLGVSFSALLNLAIIQGQDWFWVGLAFVVFYATRVLAPRAIIQQSIPSLRAARLNAWSLFLTPIILGILRYLSLVIFDGEPPSLEATPFANSASSFLPEAGAWVAMFGTWGQKTLSVLQDFHWFLGMIFQTLNSFCLYGGLLAFIAFFALPPGEGLRGFVPPTESKLPEVSRATVVGYSAFMAIFLVAFFIPLARNLETWFAGSRGEAIKAARVQFQASFERVFLFLGGKYYDPRAELELNKLAQALWDPIKTNRANLIKLANLKFNQYRDNVDSYLDWYYSLSGEYARLRDLVIGGAAGLENYLLEKTMEKLSAGVDMTEFIERLKLLASSTASFQERFAKLAERSIRTCQVPAELVVGAKIKNLTMDNLLAKVAPVETISLKNRALFSGLIGVGVGALVGRVVAKIGQKTIFKTAIASIVKRLASRASVSVLASTGAGAGVGSVVPGLGTAVGAVAGFLAGLGASILVDMAWISLDELGHRDEFKAEILKAIEEERSEVLAALESVSLNLD
ncbi:MAG: hypothetical protein LBT86_02475 [Deltaproteobacteria bacterium]|nr:hypothetical protein [Deltaproteobacteria bacterium]